MYSSFQIVSMTNFSQRKACYVAIIDQFLNEPADKMRQIMELEVFRQNPWLYKKKYINIAYKLEQD